jgi:hypothetical protein
MLLMKFYHQASRAIDDDTEGGKIFHICRQVGAALIQSK